MTKKIPLQLWDLWYPQAGATGIPFARGRLAVTNTLIVHAPPPFLTVEIRSENGSRLAYGKDLPQTADRPMAPPHAPREADRASGSLAYAKRYRSDRVVTGWGSGNPDAVVERRRWQRVALADRIL